MIDYSCEIVRDAATGRYKAEVRDLVTGEVVLIGPARVKPQAAALAAIQAATRRYIGVTMGLWVARQRGAPVRRHSRTASRLLSPNEAAMEALAALARTTIEAMRFAAADTKQTRRTSRSARSPGDLKPRRAKASAKRAGARRPRPARRTAASRRTTSSKGQQ